MATKKLPSHKKAEADVSRFRYLLAQNIAAKQNAERNIEEFTDALRRAECELEFHERMEARKWADVATL